MKCPKCEQGDLKIVFLKRNGLDAYMCDVCQTMWMKGEHIGKYSGHEYESLSMVNDTEFVLEENENQDQDHREASYQHAR